MRRLIGSGGQGFVAYLLIGGASALTEWSVFWLLLKVASLHYVVAAVAGFAVATFVNYLLCIRTIFVSKTNSGWKDVAMVYGASLLALTINGATLAFLVQRLGFDPMAAKIAGTGTAFLFNFTSRRYLIFGTSPPSLSIVPDEPLRSGLGR